jgi:acetolactate synthase-1/2/3 large subunit
MIADAEGEGRGRDDVGALKPCRVDALAEQQGARGETAGRGHHEVLIWPQPSGPRSQRLTMSKQMTGAEMIVEALKDQGVDTIFGYPGGAVLPIYDAIFQQNYVKHVLVRHEQGAGHAAEGYARSTGKVGCCWSPPAPARPTRDGLTDALMDSIPLVCITGQVPTHLIGSDAFQECDTVGITRPCTKHNYLVKDVNDLPRNLHEGVLRRALGPARPGRDRYAEGRAVRQGTYSRPKDSMKHKTYRPH